MSVLDRGALEASPLADLHVIASELSIDSFRRLRRAELIDAILERQSGGPTAAEPETEPEAAAEPAPTRRRRRGGRSRGGRAGASDEAVADEAVGDEAVGGDTAAEETPSDGADEAEPEDAPEPKVPEADKAERSEPETVEGVVELLPGGSGFVRVNPPEPSDEDVYISSAQVRRCELVSGDRVSGPRRAPRRSERFASLVRIDIVNGRPASELADGVRFDDLPLAFPDQRLELAASDPALEPVQRTAPIGRGSRVTIVGGAGSGKTELLRRLAGAITQVEGLQAWLVLTGVRPEEIPEWRDGPIPPAVTLSFGSSDDAQGQALEGAVDQVRRLVARGADAVMLIDTLDGVAPQAAKKALASARNIVDGGSLTVIATASSPVGAETTLIVLDRHAAGGSPAIDPEQSWTMRRERLE
jgi:transcription termination factor Rho